MDGGAQSPQETALRLLVIDEGFPRPRTQIHVTDGNNDAFLDMGWDELVPPLPAPRVVNPAGSRP
jgi:hypothetical protein